MLKTRIAHVSLLPSCSVGIVNKLNGCAQDAISRCLPIDYLVIAPKASISSFEGYDSIKAIGANGETRLAVRFAQFRVLKELLQSYSGVVLRYPGADVGPFVLGCKLDNCIAEHHTLFIQEQSQSSPLRANVERFLGGLWLSCFRGHTAVTQQILDDVIGRSKFVDKFKVERVLPNPYNFSAMYRDGSFKVKDQYVGVVSASSFMPWHGLDRIVEMFRSYEGGRFKLLVVGDASAARTSIQDVDQLPNLEFVGRKSKSELEEIYSRCDFAFNSFGLDRLDMSVGSTLKLREYFDYSLPVISPLPDSGLPVNFEFLCTDVSSLNAVAVYLDGLNGVPLATIKQKAQVYLGVQAFNDALLGLWD